MTRIAVIDHGAGNLVSIVNALTLIGEDPKVVTSPDGIAAADAVVLPGVGATAPAMKRLVETGLDDALARWQGPLLGICVGFQLLFDDSDEDGQACLGLMPGTVKEIQGKPLPHMGWNDVEHSGDPIFAGIPSGEPFYFVHSYAPAPDNAEMTVATTTHGSRFVAAARDGRRVGVQFHPERSGVSGARLLVNFVASAQEGRRVA